jgi:hypothetical protein
VLTVCVLFLPRDVRAQQPSAAAAAAAAPEANLFIGSSSMTVPFDLPPSRLTPALALTYSSAGGPGLYGHGWQLSGLGRIQRRMNHGALTCANPAERTEFVLMLPGQTVEFFLNEGSGRGYAHVEEAFFRIHSNGWNWTVWDRSGRRYDFGTKPNSVAGNATGIYDPGSCDDEQLSRDMQYGHAWELTRITDANGNTIDIEYVMDGGVPRPDRILYGGNSGQSPPPPFEVQFVWEDRPIDDWPTTAIGGFVATLSKRLRLLKVVYNGSVVRSYKPTYDGQTPEIPRRIGRQSFLQALTQYAGDADAGGTALARADGEPASTTFTYHENRDTRFGFERTKDTRDFVRQLAPKPVLVGSGSGRRTLEDGKEQVRDIFDIDGDGYVDLVDTYSLHGGNPANCGSGQGTWNVYKGSKAGFSSTPVGWLVQDRSIMCTLRSDVAEGAEVRTDYLAADLTGDGITDFIDASADPWLVYEGASHAEYQGRIGGFKHPSFVKQWYGPGRSVSIRRGGVAALGYASGTAEIRGLRDLNGDGLLDLIQVPDASDPDWRWIVWINKGTSFAGAKRFSQALPYLSYEADGHPVLTFQDLNGDALPDQVYTPDPSTLPQGETYAWDVHLHNGRWIDGTPEDWYVPLLGGRWTVFQVNGDHEVQRSLIDVNADGLPDLVDTQSCGSGSGWPYWQVSLNRGNRFATGFLNWATPRCEIRDGDGNDVTRDALDIDGDNLIDLVDFASDAGAFRVYRNAGGGFCASSDGFTCVGAANMTEGATVASAPGVRPDILVQVENPVGGKTLLDYRPSTEFTNDALPFNLWVVTEIQSQDGLCAQYGDLGVASGCPSGGRHAAVRSLRYEGGRFDPAARVFRGFSMVSSIDGPLDSNLHPRRTTTAFKQDAPLTGKVKQVLVDEWRAGTYEPVSERYTTWGCANADTGASASCTSTASRLAVRVRQVDDYEYGTQGNAYTVTRNEAWHTCNGGNGSRYYGNVAHTWTGRTSSGGPRRHTHLEYACIDDGNSYIVDRPSHRWVTDTSETESRLEEAWYFYDQTLDPADPLKTPSTTAALTKGNLTQVDAWLDQPSPGTGVPCAANPALTCVRTATGYDSYGNVASTVDARGGVTTIEYDATKAYPAVVTSPAPFSHKVAVGHDPKCGNRLWQTHRYTGTAIPAEHAQEWQYDAYCRLTMVRLPDQNNTLRDHQGIEYRLGYPEEPTRTTTSTFDFGGPGQHLQEDVLTDALGRVLQRKRDAVVGGQRTHVVMDAAEYDQRGNATAIYAPFVGSSGLRSTLESPPPGTATRFAFDAAGRATEVKQPSGATRTTDYSIARQTTRLDECYAEPTAECAGGKVVEIRDDLGRVVEKQVYEKRLGQAETLKAKTEYTYDELDRLLRVKQGDAAGWRDNTAIEIAYDSLGRKIFLHDPDSGDWDYQYL